MRYLVKGEIMKHYIISIILICIIVVILTVKFNNKVNGLNKKIEEKESKIIEMEEGFTKIETGYKNNLKIQDKKIKYYIGREKVWMTNRAKMQLKISNLQGKLVNKTDSEFTLQFGEIARTTFNYTIHENDLLINHSKLDLDIKIKTESALYIKDGKYYILSNSYIANYQPNFLTVTDQETNIKIQPDHKYIAGCSYNVIKSGLNISGGYRIAKVFDTPIYGVMEAGKNTLSLGFTIMR